MYAMYWVKGSIRSYQDMCGHTADARKTKRIFNNYTLHNQIPYIGCVDAV